MHNSPSRGPRRSDALTRDRIVEAAVRILDAEGEAGLTLRAVTAHLSTGRGAIYHHVADKGELLAAATDGVIAAVIGEAEPGDDPGPALRALALGIFNAIDAHPWAGTQLAREPLQPAVRRIWREVGGHLRSLGVTGAARSDAGAALVNYVLGAAAQYAAGARRAGSETERKAYLETFAAEWARHDADPLVREAAELVPAHDDREQFLAGVDIFLRGIAQR